ncbi:unnamed protein product [Closterium sp. NIES-54]
MPARELNGFRKLGTPSVSQATKAALRAAEPTGSHWSAAAADAGYHQRLHVARLHLDQHHRRRHLHHRCRCLHHLRRCLHHLHRRTEAPTPGATPTSTATPSSSATTPPAAPSTTSAPLALVVAASPTRSRHSPDLLSANEVDSSSRSNRGEKGDRGTPLKERGATVAARSTYS